LFVKFTDLVHDAGHPVAYYPRLRRVAGSTNAALLLCQLLYWYGKQHDARGWLFKRSTIVEDDPEGRIDPENQSIEQETGLTYKEQLLARRQLRARGLLRERYVRSEHRLYFELDLAAFTEAWKQLTDGHMRKRHMAYDQSAYGIYPKRISLNGTYIDYTETTAESPAAASFNEVGEKQELEGSELPLPTTPAEAMHHPAIQLFQQVCDCIPGARDYQVVIETMRHFHSQHGKRTAEYLRPFWLAWSSRRRRTDGKSYDPGSLIWLTEWAINGSIPSQFGETHDNHRRGNANPPGLGPQDIAAAARINLRRRRAEV
jgi:hypothetical protein